MTAPTGDAAKPVGMPGDGRRRVPLELGPLLALAGLIGGILYGERVGPGNAGFLLFAGAAGLAAAWLVTSRVRASVAAVALLLVGCAVTQRALDGLVRSPLAASVAERADVRLSGTLAGDPRLRHYRAEALIRVGAFATSDGKTARPGGGRLVLAVASGDDATRLGVLAAGDRVELSGWLEPLDGYDAAARLRHAVARFRATRLHGFDPPGGVVPSAVNCLRDLLRRGAEPLPATERALLAGFLLGDNRALPDEVADAYRAAGLSHLLAVSGANVAFVLALVGPLLRRLGLGGRCVAGLGVVAFFAALTRFEPSVLRASAMAALTMVAALAGRPATAARILTLAVIALLLVDPFLLHSTAFALSCAASAGLVLLAGPLTRRLPGPRWLREPLAVTLAAQLGVAPLLLARFGGLPAVAPLANLLAVPVAEPVTVYGLPASLLAGLVQGFAPRLALLIQQPTRLSLTWVTLVARTAAGLSHAPAPRLAAAVVMCGALVAAGAVARNRTRGSLRQDVRAGRDAVPEVAPR